MKGKKPEESKEKIDDNGKRCGEAKEGKVFYFFRADDGS